MSTTTQGTVTPPKDCKDASKGCGLGLPPLGARNPAGDDPSETMPPPSTAQSLASQVVLQDTTSTSVSSTPSGTTTNESTQSAVTATASMMKVAKFHAGAQKILRDDEEGSSSDDNMHNSSMSSSPNVTPKTKQSRFESRKISCAGSRSPSSQSGVETTVLSCQLALLNALTSDMEISFEGLEQEQCRTRIAQISQVVRMVSMEATGLYGLDRD